eukprot:scaffold264835_cov15-Tisochrysis_lutea.AAC.1
MVGGNALVHVLEAQEESKHKSSGWRPTPEPAGIPLHPHPPLPPDAPALPAEVSPAAAVAAAAAVLLLGTVHASRAVCSAYSGGSACMLVWSCLSHAAVAAA